MRGTLSIVFANVDAYPASTAPEPFASRCVDEDFNRLWTAEVLDGQRRQQRTRARPRIAAARTNAPISCSTSTRCPSPVLPLAMAGRRRKGVALARALGMPEHIVVDAGHAAGRRLRDFAFFDDEDDPRSALLIECGQHWEAAAPAVAREAALRFLRHFGMAEEAWLTRELDGSRESCSG